MAEQQGSQQVQSTTAVNEEEFREAAEGAQNTLTGWVTAGQMGMSLPLRILDIDAPLVLDHARIATEKGVSRKLVEVAEAAGYSQEICGYYKVAVGYALLLSKGQLHVVPEAPVMLRPDFIWAPNGCPSALQVGEALGRILNVPVIGLDIPFEFEVANRDRILEYLESQLREALDILETWTGRPFDWPRLAEQIKGLAEVADIRSGVNRAAKTCPSVCSAFDLIPASWSFRAGLVEESKRIYGALREEIEGKIERGERDVPDEKIRIMWYGGVPWGKIGAIRELLARYGATLCSSQISIGSPIERGEGLDPGNPLRTAARLLEGTGTNSAIDTRIEERVKPSIEGYNVDGVIFNMARTCKINGIPMLVWTAEVEKELGVSTLVVESDAIDPAFYTHAQVENRIESFLESIADRKAKA
jgi:benzoyl-CoA reductase/2-hydroxyglutaryl-CoA dehydratase subunit BcrC/BadD/HgdB